MGKLHPDLYVFSIRYKITGANGILLITTCILRQHIHEKNECARFANDGRRLAFGKQQQQKAKLSVVSHEDCHVVLLALSICFRMNKRLQSDSE